MAEQGRRYVALDFGAESGRTIVGTIADDKLTIEPVHRYANVPVRMGGTLYWDFPRQFGDILDGLRKASADGPVHSVSVDTWGVDYGYLDARGRLIGNPVHYRDTRHETMLDEAFKVIPRDELYMATGIQFMSINTIYQMLSEVRAHDPILELADKLLMMPDIFNHFLCGADVCRVHRGHDRPDGRSLDQGLGAPGLRPPRHPHALPAGDRAAGHRARHVAQRGRRRHRLQGCDRRGRRLARHAERRGGGTAGQPFDRLHLVGYLVARGPRGPRAGGDRGGPGGQRHQRGWLRRHHHAAQELHGPVAGAAEPQGTLARRRRALLRGDLRPGRRRPAVDGLRRPGRPTLPVAG